MVYVRNSLFYFSVFPPTRKKKVPFKCLIKYVYNLSGLGEWNESIFNVNILMLKKS